MVHSPFPFPAIDRIFKRLNSQIHASSIQLELFSCGRTHVLQFMMHGKCMCNFNDLYLGSGV